MFENEEWRIIEDFPHYSVSNYGRVKHQNSVEARKITVNDKGFPIVTLFGADSKTRYLRQINALVAKAFVPKPAFDDPLYPANSVWHIDGDLLNCKADNLRWDTRPRVLEWNEMHRRQRPAHTTPRVRNNRTGETYESAYACAMAEGEVESRIIWRVERQALHMWDENARYCYIRDSKEM